jgi:hypothetical protein
MNVRRPATIYMTDEWSRPTCITLQVLYMFELEQPPFNLVEIDQRIGRIPGEPLPGDGDLLELLRQGLTLIDMDAVDPQAVLGPHGFEYMARFFEREHPEFLSVYDFDYFAELQARMTFYYQQAEHLSGRLETITKTPEAQDILDLFSRGCEAVIVPFRTHAVDETYQTLAYEVGEPGLITFYIPQLRGYEQPLFQTLTLQEVDSQLARYDGITGVSS